MSENRRERNTQIPEEAIEGAAGRKDNVDMNGYVVEACCEKEVQIPSKNNTKTLIINIHFFILIIISSLLFS